MARPPLQNTKENIIEALELRFGKISPEIIDKINKTNDPAKLKELHKKPSTLLRKLTIGINLTIAEESMIHLWMTCSELETGIPLVFYTRKGAWSEQVAATSLVKPQAIPFGRLHKIDTAYPEYVVQNKTTGVSLMENKKKLKLKKKTNLPFHLQHININAAGIDIGSESHFVAVPEGRDKESVRAFTSFTCDLFNIATWLKTCKIDTVVMESTGIYWIPLYDQTKSL